MKISHVGIGTGKGLAFTLAAALKVAPGTQGTFGHFNKLAARTTTQGECDLCGVGVPAAGVIVDCSSKGDSVTVETIGFEWVKYTGTAPAVGDLVTPAASGLVAILAPFSGAAATLAELTARELSREAGIWQVDTINTTDSLVLIDLTARL